MRCAKCAELLSAYSDAALVARQRQAVAEHLNECPDCRQELDELQALKRLIATASTPEAREGFWKKVYGQVREQSAVGARPFSWWQLISLPQVRIPALAAVAVALLTIYWSMGLGTFSKRSESLPIHSIISEHARYSLMQPLTDPGNMNYIQAASDLASLDNPVVLVDAHP